MRKRRDGYWEEYYNKPEVQKRLVEYRLKNKDKTKRYNKQYKKDNKERLRKMDKIYGAKYRARDRLIVLNHYSNDDLKCICCEEREINFLTIDHIKNNGAEERRINGKKSGVNLCEWLIRNNFPEGYQIMCFNCNLGRDKCKDKICPHMNNK